MTGKSRVQSPFRRMARPSGRAMSRAVGGVLMLALLAGCSQEASDRATGGLYRFMGSQRNPDAEMLENTVEYVVVPAARAMVHAPQALVVFERNLAGTVEQRIVLPNHTAVRGDNQFHIRAQTSRSADLGRLDFNEVTARFGGMPAPFERVSASGLNSGSDALGSYVYARENLGANTVCVLVVRRLGLGARPLPRGTQALDVVMRNCVTGTLDEALAPMAGPSLAVGGAQGTVYTLSPHAAPRG